MIYTEKISARYAYLRHVTVEDAQFILSLRTDPKYSKYINDTENDLDIQIEWIIQQQSRPDDYYFVICDVDDRPRGVISLYNFDHTRLNAEMGRLICPKSPVELYTSFILISEFAFKILGLKRMFLRMNPNNADVIAVTRKFGATFVGYGSYKDTDIEYAEYEHLQENWVLINALNNERLEKFVKVVNRMQKISSNLSA